MNDSIRIEEDFPMACDPQNLIWLDLEMTGIDVASQTIIEIALVITDKDLNVLGKWPQGDSGQAIYQPETVLNQADPWVKKNLFPLLLERVRASRIDLDKAQELTVELVGRFCPDPGTNRKEGCLLAGNSIGQD